MMQQKCSKWGFCVFLKKNKNLSFFSKKIGFEKRLVGCFFLKKTGFSQP